jgi:hypothetical protein
MKKIYLLIALFLNIVANAQNNEQNNALNIWFNTPTTLQNKAVWLKGINYAGDCIENPNKEWESKSLPLGNGSIGANILGSIEAERITFNEKTLWRGGPNTELGADYYWNVNKNSAHILKDIRNAFTNCNYEKAAELTRQNFNGKAAYESYKEEPFRFGNFTTMGEFYIETGLNVIGMSNYKRILNLDSAKAIVQFNKDNVFYKREYFISYPDNVMAIKFTASKQNKLNLKFSYQPNPVADGYITDEGTTGLIYRGKLKNNDMQFAIRIKVYSKGGVIQNFRNYFIINRADEVTFFITADTDYKINFNPNFKDPRTYVGTNPEETTKEWIENAAALGYENLFKRHYTDYSNLFNRVTLNINNSNISQDNKLPTDTRLAEYRNGKEDYALECLYYQYGRYLLISSSRQGNLPANLQGIWHNNVDGPWRVDYHNNINLQMNYWPACATNLSECMIPLIDFIQTLVKPGEVTAKSYFGARGWTASVSGNIFGFTSPLNSQDMSWNFSPIAGPWLATHIWEYYDYNRDEKFLKKQAIQ